MTSRAGAETSVAPDSTTGLEKNPVEGAPTSALPTAGPAEDPLAVGRRLLGSHYAALARGAPDPRHAREAVRALRRAARGGDGDGRARALLAEAAVATCAGASLLLRTRMVLIAGRSARAALRRDPDRGEAHAALGLLALHAPTVSIGRAARAREHLERAVRLEPGRADWRAWLARACREAGDEEAAGRQVDVLRVTLPAPAADALLAGVLGEATPNRAPEPGSSSNPARTLSDDDRSRRTIVPGTSSAIEVRGARRGYPGREVLRGVDLDVRPGEIVALVGANGAGKSTLLGAIAGRVALERGHADVLGHRVVAGVLPGGLGHAPQSVGLYPLLTVREHLAAFARLHGLRGAAERAATDAAVEWCGLADRRNELTRTLSGGMRRRLAIALAAVHEPDVLLLDEPMTGIDSVHRERIWRMLRERARRGTALLCAAPHADDVARWTDRVVELVDGGIATEPSSPCAPNEPEARGDRSGAVPSSRREQTSGRQP